MTITEIYIDIDDVIPEYVDRIKIKDEEDYINALILCNNDFAISLIMPLRIASLNLIDYME